MAFINAALGLRFTFGLAAFLAAFLGAAFLAAFLGAAFLATFFLGAAFLATFLAPAFLAGAFLAFFATVFKIFLVKPDANKKSLQERGNHPSKKLFTLYKLRFSFGELIYTDILKAKFFIFFVFAKSFKITAAQVF
jgi:hypothetical protein